MTKTQTKRLVAAYRRMICKAMRIRTSRLVEIADDIGVKVAKDNKFTMHQILRLAKHLSVPLPPASTFGTEDFDDQSLRSIPSEHACRKSGENAVSRRREQQASARSQPVADSSEDDQSLPTPRALNARIRALEYELEEQRRGRSAETKAKSNMLLHAQMMMEIVDRKVAKIMARLPSERPDGRYLVTREQLTELIASRVKRQNLRHWRYEDVWHESILPYANVERVSKQKVKDSLSRRNVSHEGYDPAMPFDYTKGCVCGIMAPSDQVAQDEVDAVLGGIDDPESDGTGPTPFVYTHLDKRSLNASKWFKARKLELYFYGTLGDDDGENFSFLQDPHSGSESDWSDGMASDHPSRHPDESPDDDVVDETPVGDADVAGDDSDSDEWDEPVQPDPPGVGRSVDEILAALFDPDPPAPVPAPVPAPAPAELHAGCEGSLRNARAREKALSKHPAFGSGGPCAR